MPARTRTSSKKTPPPPDLKALQFLMDRPAPGFYRADIEFHGVDHSGASLEARVFIDNTTANAHTALDPTQGYVDSFYIFGHGGCFGDDGHCDVPTEPSRPFDLRPQHQLTAIDVRVVATEPIRAAVERPSDSKLTVTVVPVIEPEDAADYKTNDLLTDPLSIQQASLITYG
jgi:hypothetical protein